MVLHRYGRGTFFVAFCVVMNGIKVFEPILFLIDGYSLRPVTANFVDVKLGAITGLPRKKDMIVAKGKMRVEIRWILAPMQYDTYLI